MVDGVDDHSTPPVLDEGTVLRLLQLRASLSRNGADVLQELLSLFESDSATRIQCLRDAYAAGDDAELRRTAHALKGAAANLGAQRVSALCQQLESHGATALAQPVAAVELRIVEAIAALRQRFA